MSASARHHKRTCFRAWSARTQKHVRATRSALLNRAAHRLRLSTMRVAWRDWCRLVETESWERAHIEAERCIFENDELCQSTIDTVRIKAGIALTGRISTLRGAFLLWQNYAVACAREQQDVEIKLSQFETRLKELQSLFDRWLESLHTESIAKKHDAALRRERMRSTKVKMRAQNVFIQFTERRIKMERQQTFFSVWLESHRSGKQNKQAVTRGLQRIFRNATANAWEQWLELVAQARLLRKVTIKLKNLNLKAAFEAWDSLKSAAAEEAAELHLRYVHAEAAFGRHTQSQTRYVFNSWKAFLATRRKHQQILARVSHKREVSVEKTMYTRWVEATRLIQQERKDGDVVAEREAQKAALEQAQALLDRSAMGHMLDPRLVMLRRGFRIWSAVWRVAHDLKVTMKKFRRVQGHHMLSGTFQHWVKVITNLEGLSTAQLAARGKTLMLHGNGPALARWFHYRCDSMTKRIGTELTDLLADSQLYEQSIDIGGEWTMDVPPAQECSGRFWLRTAPPPSETRQKKTPTPRKAPLSPSARLGNPDVYAASQTRSKVAPDKLAVEDLAFSPRTPSSRRAGVGDGRPQLAKDGTCCVFELRMGQ